MERKTRGCEGRTQASCLSGASDPSGLSRLGKYTPRGKTVEGYGSVVKAAQIEGLAALATQPEVLDLYFHAVLMNDPYDLAGAQVFQLLAAGWIEALSNHRLLLSVLNH
jgi:hypothetical protein